MRKTASFILFLLLAVACGRVPSADWSEGSAEPDGRALHTLVLHDVPEGSRVWFQELFDGKTSMEGPTMNHYQGTSWYIDIPESGTVTLKYYGRPLPRRDIIFWSIPKPKKMKVALPVIMSLSQPTSSLKLVR